MSVESKRIVVRGDLEFTQLGSEVPVPVPESGVLTISTDEGAAILIDANEPLRGFIYVTGQGEEIGDDVLLEPGQVRSRFIVAGAGDTRWLRHNATLEADGVTPIPPHRRLYVTSGRDLALVGPNAQVNAFFVWFESLGTWGWRVVDRSPIQIIPGSVEFLTGVPVTLYTVPLLEGQVAGLRATLTGGAYDGVSATQRSRGVADAVGSRDVGGAAVVQSSPNLPTEVGTVSLGSMAVAASGNDMLLQVTYQEDGTLHFVLRVELDIVDVPQV